MAKTSCIRKVFYILLIDLLLQFVLLSKFVNGFITFSQSNLHLALLLLHLGKLLLAAHQVFLHRFTLLDELTLGVCERDHLFPQSFNYFFLLFQFLLLLVEIIDLFLQTLDMEFHLLLTADMIPAFSFKLPQDLLILLVSLRYRCIGDRLCYTMTLVI